MNRGSKELPDGNSTKPIRPHEEARDAAEAGDSEMKNDGETAT